MIPPARQARPLHGAWQKLARARELLSQLDAETLGLTSAVRLASTFDETKSEFDLRFADVPFISPRFGMIAADAMQNVRAALNYLVWELSYVNLRSRGEDRPPVKKTQFPMNPKKFERSQIADVSSEVLSRIERMQPSAMDVMASLGIRPDADSAAHFESMLNDPEAKVAIVNQRHMLAILSNLTNQDKHQRLPTTFMGASGQSIGDIPSVDCEVGEANHFIQVEITNGTQFAEVPVRVTGPNPCLLLDDHGVALAIKVGGRSLAELAMLETAARHIVLSFLDQFDDGQETRN